MNFVDFDPKYYDTRETEKPFYVVYTLRVTLQKLRPACMEIKFKTSRIYVRIYAYLVSIDKCLALGSGPLRVGLCASFEERCYKSVSLTSLCHCQPVKIEPFSSRCFFSLNSYVSRYKTCSFKTSVKS